MSYREEGTVFTAGDSTLLGVASIPAEPAEVAVLFLVGGPQYRAGSHRQFTLLARQLAENGFASLRFDYPGRGDSDGESVSFSSCVLEVEAAVGQLQATVPSVKSVVLWGLCDAASTAMMFAHQLPSVRGNILINPWVHGGEYSLGFRLSQYYGPLLSDKDYWKRLLSGKVNVLPALADTFKALVALLNLKKQKPSERGVGEEGDFVEAMLFGSEKFQYEMLIITSEKDLTAKEFLQVTQGNTRWRKVLDRSTTHMHQIEGADHTFSRAKWRDEVAAVALSWLERQNT